MGGGRKGSLCHQAQEFFFTGMQREQSGGSQPKKYQESQVFQEQRII